MFADHTSPHFGMSSSKGGGTQRIKDAAVIITMMPSQSFSKLAYSLRTFLLSQTLALDSDSAEEQRMPEYVCIANRYEHTAVVIPVKFQAICLPEVSNGPNQCERVSLPKESGRDVLCQQRRQS